MLLGHMPVHTMYAQNSCQHSNHSLSVVKYIQRFIYFSIALLLHKVELKSNSLAIVQCPCLVHTANLLLSHCIHRGICLGPAFSRPRPVVFET